jgi:hypothetical protein
MFLSVFVHRIYHSLSQGSFSRLRTSSVQELGVANNGFDERGHLYPLAASFVRIASRSGSSESTSERPSAYTSVF